MQRRIELLCSSPQFGGWILWAWIAGIVLAAEALHWL